jgi:hypothetical protein
LWLSVEHHAGDTVSCTQAEALVLAAEKRSGQRPKRRTELLQKRIEDFVKSREPAEKRLSSQQTGIGSGRTGQSRTLASFRLHKKRQNEKPKRIQTLEAALCAPRKGVEVARKKLSKTQAWLNAHLEQEKGLRKRLEQFERENAENPQPVEACFRLDAGFGTYDNIALLIEMGYEVYVKLHNHKIVQMLKKSMTPETAWTRVGNNAEMAGLGRICNCKTVPTRSILPWSVFIPAKHKNTAPWRTSVYARDNRFARLVWQVQRPPDN